MNLRQRMGEIRQLAEKASPAHRVVVDCNAVLALLEVVDQQHRALQWLLVERSGMPKKCGHVYECRCAYDAARAALSLMDKEES